MLYDTTADVIRKALRGLDLAPSEAAVRAGLTEKEVIAASRTSAPPKVLETLAPALGLSPAALSALPSYLPTQPDLPEITRLELPFDDETVNAWLVESGEDEAPLLFDTGDGRNDVREALDKLGITGVHVFTTHEHGDHIGGLPGLSGIILGPYIGPTQREPAMPGDSWRFGRLAIRSIGLPGHSACGTGYVIEGLAKPVCVTGDALFAGSIGGCAPGEPYRQAISSIRKEILTLSPETILLPGHGPASTVADELRASPFLASL